MRALAEDARSNGLALVRTRILLHGKCVAWDGDDLVVTSLNWASATTDPDFPWNDTAYMSEHLRSQQIARPERSILKCRSIQKWS